MLTSDQIRSAVGAATITDAMKILSVDFVGGNYKFNGQLYKDFDRAMNDAINSPTHQHLIKKLLAQKNQHDDEYKKLLREKRFSEIPEDWLKSHASDSVAITTSYNFLTCNVVEELGLVSVDHVYGLNVIKDIFASFTDFFGGRSKTIELAISKSKEEAISELALQTLLKGGNGIVGLTLNTSVNDGKLSMLKVSALGTAVKVNVCTGNNG